MKKLLLLAVITLSLFRCDAKKSSETTIEKDHKIVFGHKEVLYSNILKEDREIWIHLPESAQGISKNLSKYPVLYLLDGPGHFYSVTGIIKQLSTTNGNTIVPEMIIVAIPNTNRARDLTPTRVDIDFFTGDSIQYANGGGNKFLDFMEEELIPHIEKTHPASVYRTFVGHSFGGLSVINALINKPHLFNNYVAIDPSLWWDDQAFLKAADAILSTNKFDGKSLFVGVANTMDEGMNITEVKDDTTKNTAHIRAILQFVNSMEAENENGLNFNWNYYESDNHGSVPLIATYDALRFLFPWYELKGLNQFFDESTTASADDLIHLINTHYTTISANFGYEVLPPESFINTLGYDLMFNPRAQNSAKALFNMNVQNYPTSSNAYDSMGDFYLAQKDSLKALELFTKALEVADNDFSQEKIDLLKKNLKIE